MDLLIATANPAKAREFREMLGSDHYTWHDLSRFPLLASVEETGDTFLANASLKAASYAAQTGMWALADDSGLEVDALGGKPGVHSARWAQIHKAGGGDAANNAMLLRQLRDIPDDRRTARFVCTLVLADRQGKIILSTRDTVEGRILHQPRGSNGFGYDPLFFIDALGKTTAELSPAQKHEISHRGKALRQMRKRMDELDLRDGPIENKEMV